MSALNRLRVCLGPLLNDGTRAYEHAAGVKTADLERIINLAERFFEYETEFEAENDVAAMVAYAGASAALKSLTQDNPND